MSQARPLAPSASHYAWFAVFLLVLTAYGSLIPLRYTPISFEEALTRFREPHLYDPTTTEARADWVVNAFQYALLSFTLMAAFCVDRPRIAAALASFATLAIGFALAINLEFLQLYFPPRTVSLNDLWVECGGTVAGIAAWWLAGPLVTRAVRRFWNSRGLGSLVLQALPLYVALLLITQWMPFDFVLDSRELTHKYAAGRIRPWPLASLFTEGPIAPLIKLALQTLLYLPLGALVAIVPLRRPLSFAGALLTGFTLALLVELVQVLVLTRYSDATDVVLATTAFLAGWWLARVVPQIPGASRSLRLFQNFLTATHGPPTGKNRQLLLLSLLLWAIALLLLNWQPYQFTTDPARFLTSDADLSDENTSIFAIRRMTWAPFLDYYWGSRYQALDQFARRTATFAPLGILIALLRPPPTRSRDLALVLLLALGMAMLVEFGQFFIPQRHPGTTDALIQILGALLGFILMRHLQTALAGGLSFHSPPPPPRAAARPHTLHRPSSLWQAIRQATAARSPSRPLAHDHPTTAARFLQGFDSLPYEARMVLVTVAAVICVLTLVLVASCAN